MLAWLGENWGNIVILGVLALVLILVVRSRVRAKRQGRSSCGCGCSGCAMRDLCHTKTESNEK